MTTHVERLSHALREAHPSMFGGAPLADTFEEADHLYEQVARRLVGLGVRLHQGDWERLREDPRGGEGTGAAELERNVLTVERVSNGYLIRHLPTAHSIVIADDGRGLLAATADMLVEVNELIGEVGSPYAPERIQILVVPGENWAQAAGSEDEQ